jgi:hypothetical protein
VSGPAPSHDEGLGALFVRAVEDGKAYARAEVAFYRTLAAERMADARTAAMFGVGALILAHGAFMALIVGLLITLAGLVGPGLATLIVVAVTLVLAGLLGLLAVKRIGRATRPVAGKTP